jgi:hypothetical protein
MRIFLSVLRVGVFLLALAGTASAGFLGYVWWNGFAGDKDRAEAKLHDVRPLLGSVGEFLAERERAQEDYESRAKAYPFLLAGAALGLLGGLFVLTRQDKSGAVLLLLAVAGPAVFVPAVLLVTFPLPLAGAGALFVAFLAFLAGPAPGPRPQTA